MMSPNVTPKDVVAVIEKRDGLKDQVLALANSLLVGHNTQTTDIFHALFRLGFQRIKHLAFSVEVFDNWAKEKKVSAGILNELRNHSIGVAQMAEKFFADDQQIDDAFIAGMLHDIGKLLIAIKFPNERDQILELMATGMDECRAEETVLGRDHAFLGAYLLNRWGMPYPIIEAVAYHHQPATVADQQQGIDLLAAIYFANQLHNQLDFDPDYVAMLHLEDEIDSWKQLLLAD
jgi:putative nucleotidyltransferase with HDIG domain